MVHARVVRPPFQGATLVSVDGPHHIPGLIKVATKGNFVAVVAKKEWQAIQGAQALRVKWRKPATAPLPNGYEGLYKYPETTGPQAEQTEGNDGNAHPPPAPAAETIPPANPSA